MPIGMCIRPRGSRGPGLAGGFGLAPAAGSRAVRARRAKARVAGRGMRHLRWDGRPLPDLTLAALLRQAEYPDQKVRWRAIGLIGKIGPAAEAAVPPLVQVLKDRKPGPAGYSDRGIAAYALGRIRRRPDLAVPS